ncbi:helix-turn-helix domain-containing protein [Mycolicibacterium septicum DSM 44393]|uniref:Helix-turn-helix domain-containing protein n=2 Tax=Mycolicibacterium septicum TaxID=98668 RepID=A0A7X6MSW7_9MYCO|nr:helix-turn-helix domain-containing protein [Mycolicibacterium septicum]NKZ13663.1 helix-turn-helix domain-containing protein [Mycolicibacterium septicum DSM 44393]
MSLEQLSEIPDVAEVSAYAGIPEATLRWYRSKGKGPRSFRVGRKIRYRKADVLAWLDEQERTTAKGGVR